MLGDITGKNFAVAGTKIVFFLCLDIALDIALQGACLGSEKCERARVAPAGQSRLLLHSGKELRLKCRLGFTHKACACTSSDVLKVEVCDSLHSVLSSLDCVPESSGNIGPKMICWVFLSEKEKTEKLFAWDCLLL